MLSNILFVFWAMEFQEKLLWDLSTCKRILTYLCEMEETTTNYHIISKHESYGL